MKTTYRNLKTIVKTPIRILLILTGLALVIPGTGSAQTLVCGDVLQGSISTIGQSNSYTFAAVMGDVVRFTSVSKTGGVEPDIEIINPSGVRIGGFGFDDGITTLAVTNTGNFTATVHDRNNAKTGTYSIGMVFTTPKCSPIALVCGQVLTNTFTDAAQQHTYSVSATAGEVIRLTSVSKTGSVQPDIDIFNAAGKQIGSFGYNDGINTFTFTNSGSYILLVRERGNDATGIYTLGVVYSTPKCTPIVLDCGQVLTNTFIDPAQQHTYSVSAMAGDVIRLTSVSKTGSVQPDIDIFNAAGNQIGGFGYNDGTNTFTFTNSGSYLLLVRERDNNATGTYTLGVVYSTPKCSPIPLSCGQVLTNTFIDPAQQHTYSFSAAAGDVIRLTSVSKTGSVQPDIDIFNVAGNQVGSFGYNDGINTFTFTNSGSYILLVRERGNNASGTYTLGVVYATPKCWISDLTCGATLSGTLADPAQQNNYRLIAFPGEVIHISSIPVSGTVQPDVDVFNSSGQKIGGFGFNDSSSLLTLTNGGICMVLVKTRNNVGAGTYSLSFTVTGGCPSTASVTVVPTNLVVAAGNVATFTAIATGPSPLYFQWRFSNNAIIDATNSEYNIPNAQIADAGNYSIVVSNPGGAITSSPPAVLIVKGTPQLTWTNPTPITYGAPLGSNQLNATANVPGTFTYTPSTGTVLNAGSNQTLSVLFKPTDTNNYTSATTTVVLNVLKAGLTVTANNTNRTYGSTNPIFTGTLVGVQNSDNITAYYTCSATPISPATSYPITVTLNDPGSRLTNYVVTTNYGTLTVNRAALTVTANNRTKTFGQIVIFDGTEFTATGLQNGETVGSVTLTSSGAAASASVAGSPYSIIPSSAIGGTFASGNYTITYVNGILTVTAPIYDLSAGLVAYYPLNGNALDASGNGNDGIVHGATPATDRFGMTNRCFSFNGSGQYISAPADKLPVTNRTISLWFKANRVDNRPALLGYGGSNCGNSFFLGLNHWGNGSYDVTTHCDVYTLSILYNSDPTNTWIHWVVVTDTNGMRFYLNSQLIGARSGVTETFVTGTQLGLGTISSPTGQTPYTDGNVSYLDGCLDEVRIYNRALSTNEINLLYTGASHSETISVNHQNNNLTFTLSGDPGYSYMIQSSTNLVNWSNTSITLPAGNVLQTNVPISGEKMFYRAVLQ